MYDPVPDHGALALMAVGLAVSIWVAYRPAGVLRLLSYGQRTFSDQDWGVRLLRVLGGLGAWLTSVLLAAHFLLHA